VPAAKWVNVGWSTQTSRAKFNVGHDPKEGERRKTRIEALYAEAKWRKRAMMVAGQYVEVPADELDGTRFTWNDDKQALAFAKRLAQGETVFRVAFDGEGFSPAYVARLNGLQHDYPSLAFVPADVEKFAESVRYGSSVLEAEVDRLKRSGFVQQSQTTISSATSTLHAEIERRIEALKTEHFDKVEGHVSDSGMYFVRKMKSLKEHTPDLPLSALDLPALDSIYLTIRSRPISNKTGAPLGYDTCRKLISETDNFFEWLDMYSGTGWELPAKFYRIKRKVRSLDCDSDEAPEAEVYDLDQLVILAKYATPLERILLLLGLNCDYGADQIGRAKIGEFRLDDKKPTVRRIRRKKGIRGIHPLWKQTVEGLRHVLDKHPSPTKDNFLLLSKDGQPYWRKTPSGNRAPAIPNRWQGLLRRVKKDYPDFPALPFNTLRNTSADLVRQDKLGTGEMAQLQLTHKHQSKDANLRRYSNPKIRELFRIHRRIERKLQPFFEASAKPWEQPEKQYTPRKKVDEILDLHAKGLSDKAIAKKLGISHMTVWRKRQRYASPQRAEENRLVEEIAIDDLLPNDDGHA
jgi:integrase